jgi:hypothetical protein
MTFKHQCRNRIALDRSPDFADHLGSIPGNRRRSKIASAVNGPTSEGYSMKKWHQSGSLKVLAGTPRHWHLDGLLPVQARSAGWLRVVHGRVWITRRGDAADHVLAAGGQLWLGRGEQVLVEPWRAGDAAGLVWSAGDDRQHQVLVDGLDGDLAWPGPRRPVASPRPAVGLAWRLAAAGLRRAAGGLALAARSAEAMASRAYGSICAGDSSASSGALHQAATARCVPAAR